MSCPDCNLMNEGQAGIVYYRWGNANIGLLGCPKHLVAVIKALNGVQNTPLPGGAKEKLSPGA